MSRVRTHFCTLVARLNGGVSCPMKYGTNGTMPALTNSRLGSSNSSGALGTTVWPLSPKNRNHRRRISAVSMGVILAGSGRRPPSGRVRDGARAGGAGGAGGRGRPDEAGVVARRALDQVLRGARVDHALVDPQREAQLGVPLGHRLADDGGHL